MEKQRLRQSGLILRSMSSCTGYTFLHHSLLRHVPVPAKSTSFPAGYLKWVLPTDKAGNVTWGFALLRGSAFVD